MTRLDRIVRKGRLAMATLAGCTAIACGDTPTVDRVVLVTIDTLRADRVGCYGDEHAVTPTLDRLCAEGVRFDQAIAPTPSTLPSHASLMTALDPPRHGVRDNSIFELDGGIPTLAERMQQVGFSTAAFVAAAVLDARFGLDRGFGLYDDDIGHRRASRISISFAERRADAVVDAAIGWLENAPDRFFLWVHLYDPHADYDPPTEFARLTRGDPYAGEIAFADAQLGRLVEAIEARWGADRLFLAVTSDHGESLEEHLERTHSLTIYDATQRIPLIVRAPGWPAGSSVDGQVRLVDLAPTILALSGAAAIQGVDGLDLSPIATGSDRGDRVAYVETLATQIQMGWSPLLGIRTPRWKYIRAPRPELYDLTNDPGELVDIASQEEDRVRELDALLAARLADSRPIVTTTSAIDDAERARLESLGYVVPAPESVARRTDLGEVGGDDPKDHMAELAEFQRASTLVSLGRHQAALAILEGSSLTGPHIDFVRAQAAIAGGRPRLAVEAAQRVVAERGDTAGTRVLLGFAWLSAGRTDRARTEFERAAAIDPESPDAWVGLGRLDEQTADLDGALAHFERADLLEPDPGSARLHRAALLLRMGRLEEADALIETLPPELIEMPSWARVLAAGESAAGLRDRAAERLKLAWRSDRSSIGLARDYASALDAAGRTAEAVEIWRRVHRLDPDDGISQNDLAWGLASLRRDPDLAVSLARSAIATLGESVGLLDTLATALWAREDWKGAIETSERALTDAKPGQRTHLALIRAAALVELGRSAEARDEMDSVLATASDLTPLWEDRARHLARDLGIAAPEPAAGKPRVPRAEG